LISRSGTYTSAEKGLHDPAPEEKFEPSDAYINEFGGYEGYGDEKVENDENEDVVDLVPVKEDENESIDEGGPRESYDDIDEIENVESVGETNDLMSGTGVDGRVGAWT
jgi:hypothetical protein